MNITVTQMKKLSLEILDSKAVKIIQDLERKKLIRLSNDSSEKSPKSLRDFKGAFGSSSIKEVDNKLQKLRDEWN